SNPASLKRRELIPENQPWIKGGAIVVMNPKTAEIYALASSPSFNPNDFIRSSEGDDVEKNERVNQWLETESYVAHVWDLQTAYSREKFDDFLNTCYEEKVDLTWDQYLSLVLPAKSGVRRLIGEHATLAEAIWVQKKVDQLLAIFDDYA